MEGVKPVKYDDQTEPQYKDDTELDTTEGTLVSNKLRKYPNNLVFSGYYGSSTVSNRGKSAGFWSSTSSTNANAFYEMLYPTYTSPGTYKSTKAGGRSVRCVAN